MLSNYKHRTRPDTGLETAERKKKQKNPNMQLQPLDMTGDLEQFSRLFRDGNYDELADDISSVANDYLLDSATFTLTLIGLEEMCTFVQYLLATFPQNPAMAADAALQSLYRALFHLVRCLCPVSTQVIDFVIQTELFAGIIYPHLATDFDDLDLSLTALRIARLVWFFQLDNNALGLSDLLLTFLDLPVLPGPFALEMAYLILDIASHTGFPDQAWDFEVLLDRFSEILLTIPTSDAISPLSRAITKLIQTKGCPASLVLGHGLCGQLWSQITVTPVRVTDSPSLPINRVEFVNLILFLMESIDPDAGATELRKIPPDFYGFLLTGCSAQTAEVGFSLATLRLLNDDSSIALDGTDLEEFHAITLNANEKWQFSERQVSHSLGLAWVIFCHALLFRIGPDVVPVLLDFGMWTICQYLDGDLKERAYATQIISRMLDLATDSGTKCAIRDAIENAGAISTLCAIFEGDDESRRTFMVPHIGVVCPANEAESILDAFEHCQ
jgi:hypothetical protein